MIGGAMMSPHAGTAGIGGAMMELIQSPMNRSGLSVQDMVALIDRMNMSDGIIR